MLYIYIYMYVYIYIYIYVYIYIYIFAVNQVIHIAVRVKRVAVKYRCCSEVLLSLWREGGGALQGEG